MGAGVSKSGRNNISDRVRAEQTRILYANAPLALAIGGVGVLLLVGVLTGVGVTPVPVAALATAAIVALVGSHLWLCARYRRAAPDDTQWRLWLRLFMLAALIEGLTAGSMALGPPASHLDEEFVALLAAAVLASGAIAFYGADMAVYLAFSLPTLAPHLINALIAPDPNHFLLAGLIVLYQVLMLVIGGRANVQLLQGLRLRFENIELLEEITLQKELAEEANLSKSRFLAAASHDLRQPVHALGLFVAALRPLRMDATARGLVEQIAGSIGATEELFSALLDISRLDAGVVAMEPRAFALGPLLARVCDDYRLAAEAKGIGLTLRPASGAVNSDPVMVERILRNLISNAVAYTDTGGVLVACRREQGGQRLRVEIWDTGRGVSADEQARMFDEFYQAANPERDRAKGLGLGLAIVQRMAGLLESPVSFSSRPGRGSVFRVSLPATATPAPAAERPRWTAGAASPGLSLVIDDETAIRDGMVKLLSGWGHEVVTAGGEQETLALLEGGLRRPDVILCDYRLRGGENGAALIGTLRGRYGADTPAILITGDTAPERLREAEASGLLLMHKPVPAGRLRAALGNLMEPAVR